MEIKFRPLIVLSFFSLFTLFSCGSENSNKKAPSGAQKKDSVTKVDEEYSCEGITCLSTIDWKLYLRGKELPKNVKLIIDDQVILNECLGKQKYSISRGLSPQVIYLDQFVVPKKDKVEVEIWDLGEFCEEESSFLKNEFSFEVKKLNTFYELVIEL